MINGFIENRLIRWDEESEMKYKQIREIAQTIDDNEDQDNTEDISAHNEENIDVLII